MPKEPSYYDILGLRPEADAVAIDAAYRGRSLRFRVGQPRARGTEQTGPTQEQMAQAFAILGDPESRALYDAVYFPDKQPSAKRRRRIPIWLWAIIGVWIVALLAIVIVGLRSRMQSDGGAIGRIAGQTATIVAAGGAGGTATNSPANGGVAPGGSPTLAAALPQSTATNTSAGATTASAVAATAANTATATNTAAPTGVLVSTRTTATAAPTDVPASTRTIAAPPTTGPTNTATIAPPTATSAPAPTAVPPITVPPTEVPPTAAPEPQPEPEPQPTAMPSFRATDRIGTSLSVNLRNGPGAGYASLGLLPTGTLLQATGETATVRGQLWRRFLLQDGRIGWVRDLDVFSTR